MMRYVSGRYRPPDAEAWFRESIRRHRVTAVVVAGTTPRRDEIAGTLGAQGWHLWSCDRSEEHTSELQSLMRTSYAVFCLKQKNNQQTSIDQNILHPNKYRIKCHR